MFKKTLMEERKKFKKIVMKKWEQCLEKWKIVRLMMKKCQILKIMGSERKENP